MKFDGVIFDLDGTLLDTIDDLTDSVNAALSALSLSLLGRDEVMARVGNGFKVLLERSIPESMRSQENLDIAYSAFVDKYQQCYADKTKTYAGIKQLVCDFKALGVKMAVNTNKRDDYAKMLIYLHFGEDTFLEVLGEGRGFQKKPEADGALYLARLMDCALDRVVYIGDSQTDAATGKNAGMPVIGVCWGFRGRDVLEECGVDYIVETPQEILEIIKG